VAVASGERSAPADLPADTGDAWRHAIEEGRRALASGRPSYACGVADADGDGVGDACDNCPGHPNAGHWDRDLDGARDARDPDSDYDADGVLDGTDQADQDADGVGGGYQLARDPAELTTPEIVEAIDGPLLDPAPAAICATPTTRAARPTSPPAPCVTSSTSSTSRPTARSSR